MTARMNSESKGYVTCTGERLLRVPGEVLYTFSCFCVRVRGFLDRTGCLHFNSLNKFSFQMPSLFFGHCYGTTVVFFSWM